MQQGGARWCTWRARWCTLRHGWCGMVQGVLQGRMKWYRMAQGVLQPGLGKQSGTGCPPGWFRVLQSGTGVSYRVVCRCTTIQCTSSNTSAVWMPAALSYCAASGIRFDDAQPWTATRWPDKWVSGKHVTMLPSAEQKHSQSAPARGSNVHGAPQRGAHTSTKRPIEGQRCSRRVPWWGRDVHQTNQPQVPHPSLLQVNANRLGGGSR